MDRLTVDALGVHFGDRSALEGISVSFKSSETASLLGPNGAGKSTLLKVLAGVLSPTHGAVELDGRPLRGPNPSVVYVPQRSSVDWTFPVSVLDTVLMARARVRPRWSPFDKSDREAAEEALDQVGMKQFIDVQIGQLSGGQQQRVFLGRALLQRGDVYLLDEPFSGIDVPTQELIASLFEQLTATGKTIIYATHDLVQAAKSSNRVFLLNHRLIASGSPREVMTAKNLQATFGGQAIMPFDSLPLRDGPE